MILADLSLFPLDKGIHLSSEVAKAVKIIASSGLNYQLTAMGTLVEGEWDHVMSVVDRCYKEMEKECTRIYITLKIDYKKDAKDQLHKKVEHVQQRIEGSLNI